MTIDTNLDVTAIPVLTDNYVWLLTRQQDTVIIDPGEALPVINYIDSYRLYPKAILLTHHHADHIAGAEALYLHYPHLAIYAPQEVKDKLPNLPITLADNQIKHQSFTIDVLQVPGHTLGHVAYYCQPYLFSGDTLFSAGCGRIFEGTAKQMYDSLQQIIVLPDETRICCGHEYTLANLDFAHTVFPDNNVITDYRQYVKQLRKENICSLPSTLDKEREINPFLNRDSVPANDHSGTKLSGWQRFAALRTMKDDF